MLCFFCFMVNTQFFRLNDNQRTLFCNLDQYAVSPLLSDHCIPSHQHVRVAMELVSTACLSEDFFYYFYLILNYQKSTLWVLLSAYYAGC